MDAWVVQASTGSRAGLESTDGPAIPNPSAFLTSHPQSVVTDFEPMTLIESEHENESSNDSFSEDDQSVVTDYRHQSNREVASYFMDPHLSQVHTLATELRDGEKFNQKIPPSFDGGGAYFSYERNVYEWCSITTCETKHRGLMLKHNMKGHALLWREFLETHEGKRTGSSS